MEDYILECTYIFSVLRAASFIYLYHLLSLGDKEEICFALLLRSSLHLSEKVVGSLSLSLSHFFISLLRTYKKYRIAKIVCNKSNKKNTCLSSIRWDYDAPRRPNLNCSFLVIVLNSLLVFLEIHLNKGLKLLSDDLH